MEERTYSTGEAAEKIGISRQTLLTWIKNGLVDAPKPIGLGKNFIRLWKKADIERARKFKGTLKRGPKPKHK